MSTPHSPRGGRRLAGFFGILASASTVLAADPTDGLPYGTLAVDRDMVRVGVHSELDWNIVYPSGINQVVGIDPPKVIVPKRDLNLKVRVLGASFQQAKSNNGHGNNVDGVDVSNPGAGGGGPNGATDLSGTFDDEKKGSAYVNLPTELSWSLNGSAWSAIFRGYQNGVDPNQVVLNFPVKRGDRINFGGRGWRDGSWLDFYPTVAVCPNLELLKDGDPVPATTPAFQQDKIESFLRPYLDGAGKINIGERDLILLIELGQTDPRASGFDLQDLVVLITFE